MKKELGLWQFGGFVFTVVVGTILHFLYGWTKNVGVAALSAVNESTWEHMKLAFLPAFAFACIQSKYFVEEYKGFWWVKWLGILATTVLIPVLFYTYNGAFGKSPDWLNILFFFIAVAFGYFLEYILLRKGGLPWKTSWVAILVLLAILCLFILFTFLTPTLPIFQDPITKGYGLWG